MADLQIYAQAFHDMLAGTDPYTIRVIGYAFIYPPQALLFLAPFAAAPLPTPGTPVTEPV